MYFKKSYNSSRSYTIHSGKTVYPFLSEYILLLLFMFLDCCLDDKIQATHSSSFPYFYNAASSKVKNSYIGKR